MTFIFLFLLMDAGVFISHMHKTKTGITQETLNPGKYEIYICNNHHGISLKKYKNVISSHTITRTILHIRIQVMPVFVYKWTHVLFSN